jgi:hypothetical protein
MSNVFGSFGVVFITVALNLFAFTTLIGNYFFTETGIAYLCGKTPSKTIRWTQRAIAVIVVVIGAVASLGMGYGGCSDGNHGGDQCAGYHDAVRPGPQLPGGLQEAEEGREESGVQGCGDRPEGGDGFLEVNSGISRLI